MSITASFTVRALLAVGLLTGSATILPAALISDPAGDFLPTFTGPQNGDLDVLTAQVTFDGTAFRYSSTQNGPIGTTASALFVWGVDRGTHTAGFGAFRPGVLFDAVVILRPDLSGTVIDLAANPLPPVNLAPGSVVVNGNSISGFVPANLLVSKGSAAVDYGVNLWPRSGGGNALISDFAPDNSDAAVTVVPEPSSMLISGSALAAIPLVRRRKRA